MARTYSELVTSVRDWANRDTEVLSDNIIQTSLTWAADNAYRDLMVPPLEYTQQYVLLTNEDARDASLDGDVARQAVINNSNRRYNIAELPIPADLTTFIHIRILGSAVRNEDDDGWELDSSGCLEYTTPGFRSGIVFDEKTDTRTLYNTGGVKVSEYFWTRQQNSIIIGGLFQGGDVIELYYYRRLPSLDARYALMDSDFTPEINSFVDMSTARDSAPTVDDAETIRSTYGPNIDIEDFHKDPNADMWYLGIHVDHWLREQNERILIFGALVECFSYLQEDDQALKYHQKMMQEIDNLNEEEKRRRASGGNIQVHYNSYLI